MSKIYDTIRTNYEVLFDTLNIKLEGTSIITKYPSDINDGLNALLSLLSYYMMTADMHDGDGTPVEIDGDIVRDMELISQNIFGRPFYPVPAPTIPQYISINLYVIAPHFTPYPMSNPPSELMKSLRSVEQHEIYRLIHAVFMMIEHREILADAILIHTESWMRHDQRHQIILTTRLQAITGVKVLFGPLGPFVANGASIQEKTHQRQEHLKRLHLMDKLKSYKLPQGIYDGLKAMTELLITYGDDTISSFEKEANLKCAINNLYRAKYKSSGDLDEGIIDYILMPDKRDSITERYLSKAVRKLGAPTYIVRDYIEACTDAFYDSIKAKNTNRIEAFDESAYRLAYWNAKFE